MVRSTCQTLCASASLACLSSEEACQLERQLDTERKRAAQQEAALRAEADEAEAMVEDLRDQLKASLQARKRATSPADKNCKA
eukprot:4821058-Amphidinium_carterae.1